MQEVAGLFVTKHDRVPQTLLVFKKGFWFFPGGKQEESEQLEDTLRREIYEELHLTLLGDVQKLHDGVFPAINGHYYHFTTFSCRPEQLKGEPLLNPYDSVTNFLWVDKPWELNLTDHARFVITRYAHEHMVGS